MTLKIIVGKYYLAREMGDYMYCGFDITKGDGRRMSIFKRRDERANHPDDGMRYIMQPISYYAYLCRAVYNVNDKGDKK